MKQRGRRWWAASPGQAGKQAMIEALDFDAHKLIVSTGATKLSSDFAFLGRLDATRPPKQTRPSSLLDNGPIQISKASRATLAARLWLRVILRKRAKGRAARVLGCRLWWGAADRLGPMVADSRGEGFPILSRDAACRSRYTFGCRAEGLGHRVARRGILWSEGSSDTSTTDARSRLMRAWRRHPGRADRSIASKGSPRLAIRDCAQH